jgi:hypothetical protein
MRSRKENGKRLEKWNGKWAGKREGKLKVK